MPPGQELLGLVEEEESSDWLKSCYALYLLNEWMTLTLCASDGQTSERERYEGYACDGFVNECNTFVF